MLLYGFLPMDGLVNLSRLCLIHGENLHQILHLRIAQSFQVREPGFYQGKRLLFGDGQRTCEGLRCLRDFLFDRSRRRCVPVDINFPAGQPRSQARILALLPDRERELIFIDGNLDALLLRYRKRGSSLSPA